MMIADFFLFAAISVILTLPPGAFLIGDVSVNSDADPTEQSDRAIKIAVLLPQYPVSSLYAGNPVRYPFFAQMVLPAVDIAVEQIRQTTLQRRNITLLVEDTQCKLSTSQFHMVDLEMNLKPDMYLGPGCEYATSAIGRFLGHWGVSHITAGGLAEGFRGKQREDYPTLTRVQGSYMKQAGFVTRYFQQNKWNHTMLLFFETENEIRDCYLAMGSLYRDLDTSRSLVKYKGINKREQAYTIEMSKNLLLESVRPFARSK